MEVRIEKADAWFCEVLTRATLAGRWREAGRIVPAAADALERAADRQSAVAAAIMTQNSSAHGPFGTVGAVMPSGAEGGRLDGMKG